LSGYPPFFFLRQFIRDVSFHFGKNVPHPFAPTVNFLSVDDREVALRSVPPLVCLSQILDRLRGSLTSFPLSFC